jgi:uncharacterized membrane protein
VATVTLSRIHRLALAWGLVLGVSSWTGALVLAPYVLTHRDRPGLGVSASVLAYVLGGMVCHQQPARTFFLWGAPMPVCGRCAGLYAGAVLGTAAGVLVACCRRWRRLGGSAWESPGAWRVGLVLAAAPTAATLALEQLIGMPITNGIRAAAGVVLGVAVGWVVASSLRGSEALMGEAPEVNCQDARSDGGTSPAW